MKAILCTLALTLMTTGIAEARRRPTGRELSRITAMEQEFECPEGSRVARRGQRLSCVIDETKVQEATVDTNAGAWEPDTQNLTTLDTNADTTQDTGATTGTDTGVETANATTATTQPPQNSDFPGVHYARDLANAQRYDHFVLVFVQRLDTCVWVDDGTVLTNTVGNEPGDRECRQGDVGWDLRTQANREAAGSCNQRFDLYYIYLHPSNHPIHPNRTLLEQFLSDNPSCTAALAWRNPANNPVSVNGGLPGDVDGDGTLCEEMGIGCAFLPAPSIPRTTPPTPNQDGSHRIVLVWSDWSGSCTWAQSNRPDGGFDPRCPVTPITADVCRSHRDLYTFTFPWLSGSDPLDFRYFLRDNPACQMSNVNYNSNG